MRRMPPLERQSMGEGGATQHSHNRIEVVALHCLPRSPFRCFKAPDARVAQPPVRREEDERPAGKWASYLPRATLVSSGSGEQLAVVLWEEPPGCSSSTPSMRPYVTMWGFDPLYASKGVPLRPLPSHFPLAAGFHTGLGLDGCPGRWSTWPPRRGLRLRPTALVLRRGGEARPERFGDDTSSSSRTGPSCAWPGPLQRSSLGFHPQLH